MRSKMHILVLNWRCSKNPSAGGAEAYIFQQARRWAMKGHSVTLVCADPGRRCAPQKQEVIDGINVIRMGNRLTVYLFAALYLLRFAQHYDCILDASNGIPFFSPLFTRVPVVLLIFHVHGPQWFSEFPYLVALFGRLLEQRITPWLYKDRDAITISQTSCQALIELGFSRSQLRIVAPGHERLSDIATKQTIEPRLAHVGRLKQYKRLHLLVQAVARLRERFPNIHLDVVGDGDKRDSINALIKDLNLQGNITLHGHVSEEKKAEILSAATVFATPSMQEGWGICVIEANSYGCPAVAYDVPGLSASIRHETTGLLAQSDDEFIYSIRTILENPSLRSRLSDNARKWASKFTWDSAAQETLSILESATQSRVRTSPSADQLQ